MYDNLVVNGPKKGGKKKGGKKRSGKKKAGKKKTGKKKTGKKRGKKKAAASVPPIGGAAAPKGKKKGKKKKAGKKRSGKKRAGKRPRFTGDGHLPASTVAARRKAAGKCSSKDASVRCEPRPTEASASACSMANAKHNKARKAAGKPARSTKSTCGPGVPKAKQAARWVFMESV